MGDRDRRRPRAAQGPGVADRADGLQLAPEQRDPAPGCAGDLPPRPGRLAARRRGHPRRGRRLRGSVEVIRWTPAAIIDDKKPSPTELSSMSSMSFMTSAVEIR